MKAFSLYSPPMQYLSDLNPAQRAGVEATHGPVLVIAGAGSGKTKMLTSRIIHLMSAYQVAGHNILAVTFTNKAAGEMRERVGKALGLSAEAMMPPPAFLKRAFFSQPHIGTFHSICARILRQEIAHLPFTRQFVIYDDSDQLALVKQCFTQLNISEKTFSPKSMQWAINSAKCSALEPHEIQQNEFNYFDKTLAKVYDLYQKELFKSNAVDFGEIITMTYRLLRDNPEVLARYQQLYQFIHVDEYQDTNRAQYLLVKLLASQHRNLCVVGDEDQSIYKWRGADIKNILDFEKDYPEAKIIKLEQNYRSTQTIISASSRVIANNTQRKAKTLWTDNEVGSKIKRFQLSDDRAEAELVVSQLKQECANEGYAFGDVAIFYRTNAQSRVLEDVLRRDRVPYKVVGGLRFYDRKEIKDVLAYFRVLANPGDSISFKRIINVPQRAIGKTTVDKIDELAIARGLTFEEALREAANGDVLGNAARRKVGEFIALIEELRKMMAHKTLSEFYHELMDRTRYIDELKLENTEESQSRVENLQEFDSILTEFEDEQTSASQVEGSDQQLTVHADLLLPLFLENITLASDQDQLGDDQAGSVSMMTLHTSKGLEFPLVFMVGLEEGLFPSIRATEGENDDDIEEERRLCYVGMTRAKRQLYMTHAVCRRVYGNILYHDPARFFEEIPSEFIEYQDMSRFRMSPSASSFDRYQEDDVPQISYNSSPSSSSQASSKIGKRVRHGTYGEGVIRNIEGSSQDAKVTVEFSGRVVKKFILKFANLEFLSM